MVISSLALASLAAGERSRSTDGCQHLGANKGECDGDDDGEFIGILLVAFKGLFQDFQGMG